MRVTRPIRNALIFLILLIPSAQLAWRNREMPQFGHMHDDGLYFVTAKSVAANSYRIASLPENAFQTKYPPLFPLYLSAIWRINPNFPGNLQLATLLSWLAMVVYLAMAWLYYRNCGFSDRRTWLLIGLLSVNPYVVRYG